MRIIFPAVLATAIGCAIIAPFPAAATKSKERTLYSFAGGTDGANPASSLIELGGKLYGTTTKGGTNNLGTVFSIDAKSGAESVLHIFGGGTDGSFPTGGLLNVKGTLYGTTGRGGSTDYCGSPGCGTVYSLDPTSGTETVIYSFCSRQNCADGETPDAGLFASNGHLYGTTFYGGIYLNDTFYGTVFALGAKSGEETTLYSFCSEQNCADGEWPQASLIEMQGLLYGTTSSNVFMLDPKTGAETVLHTFCSQPNCTDGDVPEAGLINLNGILYGTTVNGGANCQSNSGCGTVFAVEPKTGAESVVYSFCARKNCTDGELPNSNLIAVNGKLYGVTLGGGNNNCGGSSCGVIFSVDPATGAEKVVYAFCGQQDCNDGWAPAAGLFDVKGTLYGTTYQGGANCQSNGGCGTVFAIKLP